MDAGDADSNFIQLMKMQDPSLARWLEKMTDKYVSHDVLALLREVACAIQQSVGDLYSLDQ